MIKDSVNAIADIDIHDLVKVAVEKVVNQYYDPKLTVRLQKLIESKCKQKNKNGAAINSYSGRFNVRAVASRDDYKWWAQQNRSGHIKMYSKVHFNLFIDNSGSFSNNDVQMNKFIQSLNRIKSKDFDFDVITINTHIVEWPNTKLMFHSRGGTHLSKSINEVIKKHTQPRTNNYNIVCFDGDASPDTINSSNAFKFFDSSNTIIVTDSENARYVSNMNQAKIIITKNYCREFIDAIINLMERTL